MNKKTQAEKVEENPEDYYGKKVNYTAPNGVNDWKIFYSDGRGIYLITSEYVDPTKLPEKDGVKPDQGNTANYPKAARFNNILTKYNGSSDITDEKMKAFNRDYFDKNYTSGNNINFKAVAYMLDKEIWSELYADSSVAEYAVGGPSVEMLLKSYCITHSEKQDLYKSRAANAMWLASPSACGETYVMSGGYYGYVTYDYYSDTAVGFRPLVYLNSDISLKWNEVTQKYDIE